MSWDSLGLLSIVVAWVGLFILIWKWKGNKSMTFSQHAAKHKSAQIYYFLLWAICLPPFYWFMINPFSDKLGLGLLFKLVVSLATFCMLVAASVPEIAGWKYTVHRLAAFGMAWLFVPLVVLVLTANASAISHKVAISSLIYMVFCIAILQKNRRNHPKMLILQGLYIVVFDLAILVAFYSS